jgi:hypothetical protein
VWDGFGHPSPLSMDWARMQFWIHLREKGFDSEIPQDEERAALRGPSSFCVPNF